MAHQGPGKGAQPRTLRSTALSKVDGKNLSDSPGYFAQGGHPVTAEHPMQPYQDQTTPATKVSTAHPSSGVDTISLSGSK